MNPITPEWLPALPDNAPAPVSASGARMRYFRNPLASDITDIPTGISLLYACRETFRWAGISRRLLAPKWCGIIVTQGETGESFEVHPREWPTFMVREGMRIYVRPKVRGGGGKSGSILGTILTLAVVAAAAWAGPAAAMAMGLTTINAAGLTVLTTGGMFASALISGGTMMAGALIVNAICPPSTASLTSSGGTAADTWSITGTQNQSNLYGMIPWVLGKVRYAPVYLATPYTLLKESDQYLRCLFGVAGRNQVKDIRIGDTDVNQYEGVSIKTHEDWKGETLSLFPSAVFQEDMSVSLLHEGSWQTRTTTDNTVEIQWELFFTSGMMVILDDGRKFDIHIYFQAQYRKSGASSWTDYGTWEVNENTTTPFRRGYIIKVPEGQYDFRIRRLHMDYHSKATYPDKGTFIDTVNWSALRSVQSGPVVVYDGAPLTLIELEIKATDQLNGAISELNAEFTSYAPAWNGSAWVETPTSNPAALGVLLAVSPHVRKNVPADAWDFIDSDAWAGFYQWCVKHGWSYNSTFTSQVTVREALHNILSSARAASAFRNNMYSVVWDHADKEVVYPFGPRNSWGFAFKKEFLKEPTHGLRVRFLNETADYQEDEKIVYADGYSKTNATNLVESEFDGVTNPDLIYKLGRLRLADSTWRPATYEISTDYSFVAVQKGDRVAVTHDVPMWGIQQARVTGLSYAAYAFSEMSRAEIMTVALENMATLNPEATLEEFTVMLDGMETDAIIELLESRKVRDTSRAQGVYIDDHVSMDGESLYGLKVFSSYGPGKTFSVISEPITTNILYFQSIIPTSTAPAFGDLVHFGLASRQTHDCIVVAVEPADGMTAKITMQDYSVDQIYAALTGSIPAWDSDITVPSRWQLNKPAAPELVSYRTDETVLLALSDGSIIPRIQVAFSLTERQGVDVDRVRIQTRLSGSGEMYKDAGSAPASSGFVYATDVEEGLLYDVRLYAISSLGAAGDFSAVYTNVEVIGRTTPPPAPLRVNVDGARIWWEMPENTPIDVRGWEVWMGLDETSIQAESIRITNPMVPVMEYDMTSWGGRARRVWVRTVDDIGLVSAFVTVAINIGDIIIDNVVEEYAEGADRGWPGKITDGSLDDDIGLIPNSSESFWRREAFWTQENFWMPRNNSAMVYMSEYLITEADTGAWFSLDVDIPYGVLASAEYRLFTTGPFWDRDAFFDTNNFWNSTEDTGWTPLPDKLWINAADEGRYIEIRVTTKTGSPGIIREIYWTFDVEDENDRADDLTVPAEGIRVPLNKTFRKIKNVQISVQSTGGGESISAAWEDKGVIVNGLVSEGPLVYCRDAGLNRVAGVCDITMQGVKGAVKNG